MNEIIRAIEMEQLRTDIPKFSVGDTVRVQVKVVEGSRERLQAFEGTVIARRNGSCRETFTVRRVSYGIGVERTFPIHSPRVDSITVIRRGKVRRAKLYYLRARVGKARQGQGRNQVIRSTKQRPHSCLECGLSLCPAAKTLFVFESLRNAGALDKVFHTDAGSGTPLRVVSSTVRDWGKRV